MAQIKDLKTGIKYKDTPIGKIPVDWEVVRLSDVSEINMGQSPPSEDCSQEAKGLPFYQGNADFGSKYPSPQKWCINSKKIANEGDILISVRAPVGDINIAPHKCCIGRGLAAVSAKAVHDEFLYHSLFLHMKALQKIAQGSTFEAVNSKELSDLMVFLPPVLEQKKIAEFLTAVDEAIDKIDQIIEKTKEVKKGLMQKLLTRGIGHKKFKKTELGEIPEKWEIKTFKKLLEGGILSKIQDGNHGNDHPKSSDYVPSGVPFIMANNLVDGTVDIRDCKFIRKDQADKLRVGFAISGDVLLSHKGTIGRVAIVPEIKDYIMLTPQVTYYRIGRVDKLSNAFLRYVMESRGFQEHISKLSKQSTRNYIGISQQKNLFMVLPSLNEQKQIAEILSSVDNEIVEELNHKDQLESLKRGLMQVLLTGKIRVSV
jgi:type I restriction enzyme S subunit